MVIFSLLSVCDFLYRWTCLEAEKFGAVNYIHLKFLLCFGESLVDGLMIIEGARGVKK